MKKFLILFFLSWSFVMTISVVAMADDIAVNISYPTGKVTNTGENPEMITVRFSKAIVNNDSEENTVYATLAEDLTTLNYSAVKKGVRHDVKAITVDEYTIKLDISPLLSNAKYSLVISGLPTVSGDKISYTESVVFTTGIIINVEYDLNKIISNMSTGKELITSANMDSAAVAGLKKWIDGDYTTSYNLTDLNYAVIDLGKPYKIASVEAMVSGAAWVGNSLGVCLTNAITEKVIADETYYSLKRASSGDTMCGSSYGYFAYDTMMDYIDFGNKVNQKYRYVVFKNIKGDGNINLCELEVYIEETTSGVCGTNQDTTWKLDRNGVFTISGKGAIPDFVEANLPWADIRNYIKTVVIQEGITSIGGTSFYQCTNLKSISLPDSLTTIGNAAFSGCTSLGNITFPKSLENIGKSAFYNCTSMTRIELPESITVLGNWAFSTCINVSEINWKATNAEDLSNSIRAFPNLGNNTSGVKVTFASGVKRVPAYVLYGNPNISTITLSDSIESIGIYAFDLTGYYNDSSNWENNVLYVGKYLIKAKNALRGEYTVKDGTRMIAEYALSGCSSLKGVTIPKSVELIGEQAFYNCTGLQNVTLPFVGKSRESEESAFRHIFGSDIPSALSTVTVTDADSIADFAFYGCQSIKNITVEEKVQRVGAYAFSQCCELENITLPDSITSIGEQAFGLTAFYNDSENWENDALYIEKNLIEIKDTFSGEFSVKENTKCIADDAFKDCIGLNNVKLPDSVCNIGNYAFYNCDGLTTLTIPQGVKTIGIFAFSCCDNLKSVTIPESDLVIGNYAFCNSALSKIPDVITGVGESTFSYCSGLKDVTVKNNTTYRMYYGCDNLKYVKIDSGVTNIAPYSFGECTGVETLVIPKSVTKIETGAFENCYSIRTIKYEGSEAEWAKLKIAIKNEILLSAKVLYNSPIPERIVYVDVDVSDGTFTVTPTGVAVGEEIIFACYNGNQLSYVENVTYQGTDISFKPDTEYNKVKVFVWNSISDMIPVSDDTDVKISK